MHTSTEVKRILYSIALGCALTFVGLALAGWVGSTFLVWGVVDRSLFLVDAIDLRALMVALGLQISVLTALFCFCGWLLRMSGVTLTRREGFAMANPLSVFLSFALYQTFFRDLPTVYVSDQAMVLGLLGNRARNEGDSSYG